MTKIIPVRIQRSRQHKQKSPNGLPIKYVGRPGRFGNPIKAGMYKDYTSTDAVRDYEKWIKRDLSLITFDNAFGTPPTIKEIKKELAGKNLSCWCKPGAPCHADILLKIANS